MATASESFIWDTFKAPVRLYCGLAIDDESEDTLLQIWFAAAAEDLDEVAGWYYTDENGDQVDETPTNPSTDSLLVLGVLEWVKAVRAMNQSPASAGVGMAKTGALQEQYTGGVSGIGGYKLARRAAIGFWAKAIHNLLLATAPK